MWVARDKDSDLVLFSRDDKPIRVEDEWEDMDFPTNERLWCVINGACFPELKWEDEPIEVEIIKKK